MTTSISPEEQRERIQKRYKALRRHVGIWIDDFADNLGIELTPDPSVLYLVAQSALIDIDRYKDHHLREDFGSGTVAPPLSDEVKRAAYFAKWLRKMQPLSLSVGAMQKQQDPAFAKTKQQYASLANVGFAVTYALNCLAENKNAPDVIILEPTVAMDLIYNMTYREISGDSLINKMQMIQSNVLGKSLVMGKMLVDVP